MDILKEGIKVYKDFLVIIVHHLHKGIGFFPRGGADQDPQSLPKYPIFSCRGDGSVALLSSQLSGVGKMLSGTIFKQLIEN